MKDEARQNASAPTRRLIIVAALFVFSSFMLHPSSFLQADAIWQGPPNEAPMLQGAMLKILRIEGDKLVYEFHGNERSIEIAKITRISADGETALNAAEDALALDKHEVAVDGFQRVARAGSTTGKPWMSEWASRRLLVVAQKSGRFDAAVAAYIARVMSENPSAVPRPHLPDERSSYLDTASADVNSALSNPKINDEQRVALLSFLVDVQRARKDTRAADLVAQRLDEVLAKDLNNPQAGRAIARRRLQTAQSALDKKDFKQALSELEAGRAQFTDPTQQADALYMMAEARLGLASSTKQNPPSSNDVAALQDAALAFMRVVAHFKDAPDRPRVAQSILRAGQICEMINDAPGATRAYTQLVQQYPDDPNTAAARQGLDRLKQIPTTRPADGAGTTGR
ncbi:MAG: hypothetical protein H7Z14_21910 [Anaerolineae bacterium]|nr:hypothetical protein [Phycisphaerae bacterium]